MLTARGRTRGPLLRLLRRARGPLSGEEIARGLGVSRVAVWRQIQALAALGYPVEASRRGYLLGRDEGGAPGAADLLLPWEFPELQDRLRWSREVSSTMDEARRLAEGRGPERAIVVAERQSRGRGRNGRPWRSPAGGLYATYLRRAGFQPGLGPRHALAAALAVSRVLERLFDLQPTLRWPNDVLLGGLKLSGVLVESGTGADGLPWLAVGVGLNVSSAPQAGSCSLAQALGSPPRRGPLFQALCGEIDAALDRVAAPSLLCDWRRRSDTPGLLVEVATPFGRARGRALDVDDWGALVLRRENGALYRVPADGCRALRKVG